MLHRLALPLGLALVAFGCSKHEAPHVVTSRAFAEKHRSFDDYWFRGLAEIDRFELHQERYGETHDGDAVFVFVAEPFLKQEQVKYDGPSMLELEGKDPAPAKRPASDVEQVLKLNAYRRFWTGVYPYTMLTSTFTPTQQPAPMVKLAESIQEWCGIVYAQLNLQPGATSYRGAAYSYFQNQGDRTFDVATTNIEDELFARIRLGPGHLPTGTIRILPSTTYLQLLQKPFEPVTAEATLSPPAHTRYSTAPVRTYTLRYPAYGRTVKIYFEARFPYRVVGFEDTHRALFDAAGGAPPVRTTRAKLTKSIMLDYWNHNRAKDAMWRRILGVRR